MRPASHQDVDENDDDEHDDDDDDDEVAVVDDNQLGGGRCKLIIATCAHPEFSNVHTNTMDIFFAPIAISLDPKWTGLILFRIVQTEGDK